MSAYVRVRDWRVQQLHKLPCVEIFLETALTAEDVLQLAPGPCAGATAATWRAGRHDGPRYAAMAEPGEAGRVFAPDAIMDGVLPERAVVIFDRIFVRLATLSRRTRPSAVREALDAGKPIGNGLGVDIPETANCIRRHAEAQHKLHDQIAPLAPDALA